MTGQLAITTEARCPICLQHWIPEQLGDTKVCDDCWKSDDRSEKAMLRELGDVPWTRS